ncbi:uncharacterized protein LOC110116019 isoform X3 [Dendrobium catenatum]|uniref:uncharacterized protein LOC110116019 isoform X3 n=1 Tax=Dendrobium catenatum TaxID=906689 RepID=UPI0009F43E47|nr:uncharacterized protein LOC110116019 isoform X3 [Dendrobium catenatum]
MALWVRSGGYGGIRRFPGILLPRPLVAAERAWKKGIERKGWVRAMRCSLQWEADTQPRDEVREIVMEKGEQHIGINCDLCNGIGWLICDFCQGQKTNVKSESSSRFYRRCPYCKAVGLVLCPKCKVFKCVTFPDVSDRNCWMHERFMLRAFLSKAEEDARKLP